MRVIPVLAIALIYLVPSPARADSVDLPALVIHACQTRDATLKAIKDRARKDATLNVAAASATASAARLCADGYESRWRQYQATQRAAIVRSPSLGAALAVRDLPRQYIEAADGGHVCEDLTNLAAPGSDQELAVGQLCSAGAAADFRSAGVESVAIDLVQGLGDLIEAEAKAEVTTYMLETVGKGFCNYKLQLGSLPEIALGQWFTATCAAMLSTPENIVETFTFGDLEIAFKADLQTLPDHLKTVLLPWFNRQSTVSKTLLVVLGVVAEVGLDTVEHKTPIEILQQLGTQADDATRGVTCDLAQSNTECVALLLIQIARTAADEYAADVPPPPSKILADAFDAFCAIHGGGKSQNGACVVDPGTYLQWHTRLIAFYRAVKQMTDVQGDLDRLRSQAPTDELKARTAKEFAASLQAVVRTFGDILTALPSSGQAVKDDVAVLTDAVAVYAAIIASDPLGLRKALVDLLDSPLISAKLGASTTRAITVVISLATAKDRAEVKGILADVTAPVGTYKMKYGAPRQVVTVNGYVGTLGGGVIQLAHHDAAGADDGTHVALTKFRISAPIGLDWTFLSSPHWHLGLTATVIDPLALAVSTADDQLSANWKTLIDAGLYLRLGIYKSPFQLMVGGNYQPGLRDDSFGCGAQRCYDGGIQFGAMLSADVPLFILH